MQKNKKNKFTAMNTDQRYEYFIRKVTDFQVLWGLSNNGWATSKRDNKVLFPIWPEKEFANICATDEWKDFKPTSISLDDFMGKWIVGAARDSLEFLVFPLESGLAKMVSSQKILFDLKTELQQY